MKKIRILFQGDSITDAGRDKRNYYHLGAGYPKFTAPLIKEKYPDTDFEFINLGISGNRTDQLFDRMYEDIILLNPDVVSILIGINDVWHRHGHRIETTDEQFAANYRAILNRIKTQTNAKIMILAPFLLDSDDKESWRPEVDSLLQIVRELADEYADAYIPLDKYFEPAVKEQPSPHYYSGDGVHPNPNGAAFIAKHYVDAISPVIEEILAK